MATGILEVELIDAKGLGGTDIIGDIDPYVLIQYKGQEHKSTVAKGDNPVWNEKFLFNAQYPVTGDGYKIILKVWDKDTLSSDDYIGQATIYIKDLLAQGVESGTAQLPPNKYSVVGEDLTYLGEVEVGVIFTRKDGEVHLNDRQFGGWRQSGFS
ncbi:16 kDa phloem protein 1 [Ziziphus jujuba]|uniref:16 kDa phloem protein 1 n=2 Tax=Ziziphus jujuba TaxID=326968 RepID=A0A6P3ZTL2_ZIZJJ|nr:16 kDa phloem protein 1 [Ziziphus jujuba]KAH7537192.1 hypothetical protein FEM48_Zijuj03G0066200 [Ziziphus jujuba var. spinosa]